jgi:L-histidine Nalpha-methyltransferase
MKLPAHILHGGARPFPRLSGHEPPAGEAEPFRADVIAGLSRPQKSLAPKYFYDATGAALFDRICDLPEYYLARAELEILGERGEALADLLGDDVTLVELGSGSSLKTRLLLDRLRAPRAYVPLDICAEALARAAAGLRRDYPGLLVQPARGDYTRGILLPPAAASARRIAVFFPGSTIGNCEPHEAMSLLRKIRRRLAAGGWLIVGVDTPKSPDRLERAYNDSQGVTARFNRNVLVRVRDELGADVDPDAFEHLAFYNVLAGRIEMHLRSAREQHVELDGRSFRFRRGETLHTENSYKYTPAAFAALAREAGFSPAQVWHDAAGLFSVHVLGA